MATGNVDKLILLTFYFCQTPASFDIVNLKQQTGFMISDLRPIYRRIQIV